MMFSLADTLALEGIVKSVDANLGRKGDIIFSAVATDSREVNKTTLFFALPGVASQGWEYLKQVEQLGCLYAVVPAELAESLAVEQQLTRLKLIKSSDPIGSLAQLLSKRLMRYPEHLVAVTGTNGKSSISFYIAQLAELLGRSSAIVGTFGVGTLDNLGRAEQTTPDIVTLHKTLNAFYEQGVACVAFEASSHALQQRRTAGVPFKTAVYANLSRDHLDYHGDMASYASAKRLLFAYAGLTRAVINLDDEYAAYMAEAAICPIYFYSTNCANRGNRAQADFYVENVIYHSDGIGFDLTHPLGRSSLLLPLLGEFNVANFLAAIAALWDWLPEPKELLNCTARLQAAPGRMQKIANPNKPLVVVDYAHTPASLASALLALRCHTQGRIVCVFGCGGDRDAGKRPLMTQAALHGADRVCLTSDNPRFENPQDIIKDALQGVNMEVEKERFSIELDRARAIQAAIQGAKVGDTVLIAGKGHEDYQDIAGVKYHFDDVEVAKEALAHYVD